MKWILFLNNLQLVSDLGEKYQIPTFHVFCDQTSIKRAVEVQVEMPNVFWCHKCHRCSKIEPIGRTANDPRSVGDGNESRPSEKK